MVHRLATDPPLRERTDPSHRRPLSLLMTPHGQLRLQPVSDSIDVAEGVEAEAADRIEEAFSASEASGLLHLATREASTELTPSLMFGRRIGIEFLHAVCSLPEHETTAADLRSLEVPRDIQR